jgi:Tfp pilus assembly protein FimT
MKISYNKGIALAEILITLAVIIVLAAIIVPQFKESREMQTLNGAVGDILSALNKARTQTLASLDSSSYGVHFSASEVIIFKGSSYIANDPDNETINIISPASISNVTLGGVSGNSGNLYFERLSGDPSKSGTVTVSSPSFSKIITITATGSATAD